jgi:hypothetical protein
MGKYTKGVDRSYKVWYNGMMIGCGFLGIGLIISGLINQAYGNVTFGLIFLLFIAAIYIMMLED